MHILLIVKDIYSIQPYEVGTKNHKSLAIIIPSQVKKQCNINTSSIFYLEIDRKLNRIYLSGPTASSSLVKHIDCLPAEVFSGDGGNSESHGRSKN